MAGRVLVAVDTSEQAERAYDWTLEEMDDDEITLLHVLDPIDPGFIPGVDVEPDGEDYPERAAETYLEELAERGRENGVDVETVVEEATVVSRAIVEEAERGDYDHVVVGSHGRQGAARILLGSVAEKVVRRSPTPVTVVR
ncbi:MAG: universal stress protein [Halobacteriales archaeon]